MRKLLTSIFLLTIGHSFAQLPEPPKETDWKKLYRAAATKTNDLVHTKVDAHFDYAKCYMYGKAWITLKPHFYPTDSLSLDAKGMNINLVQLVKGVTKVPLKYTYDSLSLNIKLDKIYKSGEKYTVYIDYVSKPNELKEKGSAAINDAKGLYFINPKGEDKKKPIQIWTQGETESNSAWVPTIDKPNQKTTDEIIMTVPDKYVTLSNGRLVSQTKNADGTRTDDWKMELPHAPYLMFMGVGDFAIIKDNYKGKEVSYYVEKEDKDVARKIFGLTPEMMKFFSEKVTGIEYPWAKYSQMIGRDYVSGAMENTTATLHGESAKLNARQLTDGNSWEFGVAHELFHQWFGDLVTTESWSNITVNESMADYSEYLWKEYKYGADEAGDENYTQIRNYLRKPKNEKKDLVRFYYQDKEDVFDDVSYPKGGRIVNMLRHYVGDSAFFKSLNLYLNTYKFGNGSAHKLRLCFEQVSGRDLNWFFNQWYFSSGHPKVEINYGYDENAKKASVYIKQTQDSTKTYKLPLDIDIFVAGTKTRSTVWNTNRTDTFTFDVAAKPDLINVDGDKYLLWEKKDNKSLDEFIYQYNYAKKFLDRREALVYAGEHKDQQAAVDLLKKGTTDPYYKLRIYAIKQLADTKLTTPTLLDLANIARKDNNRLVRAAAIDALAKTNDKNYLPLYSEAVHDSSYSVSGAALEAIASLDETKAIDLLPELKKDSKERLKEAVNSTDVLTKSDNDFEDMTKEFVGISNPQQQFDALKGYVDYLGRLKNTTNFKKGVDTVIVLRDKYAQFGVAPYVNKILTEMSKKKKEIATKNGINGNDVDDQLSYIKEKTKE